MSTATENVNGYDRQTADPVAQAKADAIRSQAYADAEAKRIEAEGKAKAEQIKAAEEAEKQRLANERSRMRLERERADQAAKLAEANRKREESERQTRQAREAEQAEQQAVAEQAQDVEVTALRWRRYALGFYVVCAIVALPVQVAAFWDPSAWWLVIAPFMLEGGAAVVLKGAAAAVAAGRPHWHYRLIAWLLAFIAAGINLWHGLIAFDPATAFGTAFASVAGPGVWDLHEHGRIRTRDGKLSWAERRAARKAEKKKAAEKAEAEKRTAAEKADKEKADREAAEKLAAEREEHYPEVWAHAVKLAAAMGETTVTEAVWKRAHNDIEGTDPGDSVDVIRNRNNAARRVAAARSEAPGSTPVKVTYSQREIQMNGSRKQSSYKPVPPRRRAGDTPRYHRAARVANGESKRRSNAAKKPQEA